MSRRCMPSRSNRSAGRSICQNMAGLPKTDQLFNRLPEFKKAPGRPINGGSAVVKKQFPSRRRELIPTWCTQAPPRPASGLCLIQFQTGRSSLSRRRERTHHPTLMRPHHRQRWKMPGSETAQCQPRSCQIKWIRNPRTTGRAFLLTNTLHCKTALPTHFALSRGE